MKEQELTRLCFLVDALVSAPNMSDRLTQQILDSKPSHELLEAVDALRVAFATKSALLGPRGLTETELKEIAKSLLEGPTKPVHFAGQALARALGNIRRSSRSAPK